MPSERGGTSPETTPIPRSALRVNRRSSREGAFEGLDRRHDRMDLATRRHAQKERPLVLGKTSSVRMVKAEQRRRREFAPGHDGQSGVAESDRTRTDSR